MSAQEIDKKDFKETKETASLPSSFEWVQGNLEKVIKIENSQEHVIFRRKETKESKERKESKFTHIIVTRTHNTKENSNPITLCFCKKRGPMPAYLNGHVSLNGNFVFERATPYEDDKAWIPLVHADSASLCTIIQSSEFDLKNQYTVKAYQISRFSKHWVNEIFNHLLEEGLLSENELAYFKQICGYARLSITELKCDIELDSILRKSVLQAEDYENCIRLAQEAYDHSFQLAKANGRIERTYQISAKEKMTVYFVESTLSFELGIKLKEKSPEHAIEAFKILKSDEESSWSPLYGKARQEIVGILEQIASSAKETAERRDLLKCAITLGFGSMDAIGAKRFLNLIEQHAGNDPNSPTAMFKNFKSLDLDQEATQFFVELITNLTDTIYKLKNPQPAVTFSATASGATATASGSSSQSASSTIDNNSQQGNRNFHRS